MEPVKSAPKPILFLVGGLVVLLASTVLFGLPQVRRAARIGAAARARYQMQQWARASEAYRQEHQRMPEGDLAAVLATLRRDPASRTFLVTQETGDSGRLLLDPWGTPWQIRDGERIEIHSAGPNRRFGDDDDLSSLNLR